MFELLKYCFGVFLNLTQTILFFFFSVSGTLKSVLLNVEKLQFFIFFILEFSSLLNLFLS